MRKTTLFIFIFLSFSTKTSSNFDQVYLDADDYALINNIMFEACGEGKKGWLAVAAFTVHEAKKKNLSIYQAVYEQKGRFTWVWSKSYKELQRFHDKNKDKCYNQIRSLVINMKKGDVLLTETEIDKSYNYYLNPEAVDKLPIWYVRAEKRKRIGNHVFVQYNKERRV